MDTPTSAVAAQAPALQGANDHPVFDIPFTADVDGRRFQGTGISLVEAFATGLLDPQIAGETRLVKLSFAFAGFSVGLVVNATVTKADAGDGTVRIAYVDPAGAHLPQLRHILNAYVAGDLISLGNSIGIATSAAEATRPPTGAPDTKAERRRRAGMAATLVLSAALIAGGGSLLHNRAYSVAVPTPAFVVQSGQTLRAVAAGQLEYLNTDAAKGEIAFAIRATSGQTLSVAMPCDCAARATGAQPGATVLAGEPVLFLAPETSEIAIGASVAPELLFDLAAAEHIEFTLADGAQLRATLAPGPQHETAASKADALIPITLTPEVALPPDRIGQLVRLRIQKPAPWVFAPFEAVSALIHRFRKGESA